MQKWCDTVTAKIWYNIGMTIFVAKMYPKNEKKMPQNEHKY